MPNDSAAEALPHVVIDVEKLRHLNTGLGRFSLHLTDEIIRLAPGRFRPILFLPCGAERLLPPGGYDVAPVAKWRKEGFVRYVRPLVRSFLPHGRSQVWHMTHQAAKYFPLDPQTPVLLTIHDLNFLHADTSPRRRLERKLRAVQRRVDRATALATVSLFTADEVRRHLDVKDKPVHVIPNGLPPPSAASPSRPAFVPADAFLLTVGNVLPHKNVHVLLGLLEHLPDRRLIVAGKKATAYGAALEREIGRRGLAGRVVMPGEVTDGDRQWLYENCEAVLVPSLAEGFGFPVLEAMQCGKPVFASRVTSLPELGGDLACYFDSFDPLAMATAFHEGMARIARMPHYAEAARGYAATYSWARAAASYANLYMGLLDQRLEQR